MSGCEGYRALAGVYDLLSREIDYRAWADFIERCFARWLPEKPELVLDLACGTGRMTHELARRGYDMIGVDGSADMLSVAYDTKPDGSGTLLLEQDLRTFELYGTVGAVTCCLDSLNYLLADGDLELCFRTIHNYLDPNGLFLFDMNTPEKFRRVYGDNAYVLEDEQPTPDGTADVFCAWQNHYDTETRICDFDLSIFEEQPDGSYLRSDEHQQERCYSMEEITAALTASGMELLGVFADWDFSAPDAGTERWYFCARAIK